MSEVTSGPIVATQSEIIDVNASNIPDSEAISLESSTQPEPEIAVAQPEPPKPVIDDKLSAKFAALSRKEQQIRQREQQLKVQSQQFEQMRQETERLKQEFEQYKQAVKQNPLQKLQEEGLSFDDLTNMQLNGQNPTPEMQIKRLREELSREYKSEVENLRKQYEADKQAAIAEKQQQALNSYQQQISDVVASNSDKYELINLNEAQSLVYEVAEEFYNSNGKILSVEEAADYVEKYLEDEAKKLFNAKKLNAQQKSEPGKKAAQPAPTLSNNLSADSGAKSSNKAMSREESLAEAARALRWNS
jgi:hypothetical protein